MAQHLVDNGYKDAAAVVAGSTLEVHLRNLCNKHSLSTVASGEKPKKADLLNAELTKVGAYSKIYQKNVTAWLSLRNHAAHGDYEEYSREQVALLVASIRDFLTKGLGCRNWASQFLNWIVAEHMFQLVIAIAHLESLPPR